MMNETAVRMWGVGLAMLTPVYLIDRFLDWVEKVSGPIMPAQVDTFSCQVARIDPLPDRSDI
ncbi:hypothetical protein [Bradyrhizobium sp. ARR65]|uniref:hypothetical protein n=1 Tax=Bradyrhizobium sp. ARR65 TaxID=1040989 RepID=UPI0004659714|nr:hypothetical protein [Bradyrhizobium sp. ARR65]